MRPFPITSLITHVLLYNMLTRYVMAQSKLEDGWQRKGKLIAITLEDILRFKEGYLYTKFVSFQLQHTFHQIYLREYFLFHPHMNIQINDKTIKENQLNDMPTFYFGSGKSTKNKTSLLGRLHSKYFNGTLRHGEQISFLNCHSQSNVTKHKFHYSWKYICVVYEDEDVQKKIKSLRALVNDCGSENSEHVHRQQKATILNRHFTKAGGKSRRKRNVNAVTCVLHLMADQMFYKHVGGSNTANTVSEMVSSVMEADIIFRGTDFSGNGQGDNIGFVIGNITIFTRETDPNNKFSDNAIGVYDYLDILTEYDFSDYCLGVGFTHRDFEKGIVGLAWVASSNVFGSVGGICQRRIRMSTNNYRSYNTAIVTYLNFGIFIPSQKSALTLTHELGHSFGSSHDSSTNPTCSPGGVYGSFLMDPYTNSGEKPNHRKFSLCSVNTIYPVIINKGNCLKRYSGPICGNSVMEGTEECDCGTIGTCSYSDSCCTPQGLSSSIPDQACTIRRSEGKVCSPKSSACCDPTCQLISQSVNHVCKRPTECSLAAYCDGTSANCPVAQTMPNGMLCDGGRKTCFNGECSSSICQSKNLDGCQCEGSNFCEICCKNTNITGCKCKPATYYGIIQVNGDVLYKHRGEPCNNFKGFCDNNNCISDDHSDIHSRMNQIFSQENIDDIVDWFQNFWFYILLVIFVLCITAGVYKATYMKIRHIDLEVESQRYGKLLSICHGAEGHIQYFKKQIKILSLRFDEKVLKIKLNKDRISPVLAISRLQLFFPDCNITDISHVVYICSSEECAVKMLLMKGYSMKKFSLKVSSKSKLNLKTDLVYDSDRCAKIK